jgi:hypothetical protein
LGAVRSRGVFALPWSFFKEKLVKRFFQIISRVFVSGFQMIRSSKLAKILLLIVFIKFLVFYGFLKGFLYPRYLKPHYESDKHRSEQVLHDLTTTHKPAKHD